MALYYLGPGAMERAATGSRHIHARQFTSFLSPSQADVKNSDALDAGSPSQKCSLDLNSTSSSSQPGRDSADDFVSINAATCTFVLRLSPVYSDSLILMTVQAATPGPTIFFMSPKFSSKQKRLLATIFISFLFLIAEIAVAVLTSSLALLADAFHYLNDLIGLVIALTAVMISERNLSPHEKGYLSFGWQRAQILGAFFNGVFVLALALSIFLQSMERFVSMERIERPELVFIMGCVGLSLNFVSATILYGVHEHGHGHGHDHHRPQENSGDNGCCQTSTSAAGELNGSHFEHRHRAIQVGPQPTNLGMLGALMHVMSDALNNIGVIIAAAVIWKTKHEARFYADPALSMCISFTICITALPLMKRSGLIMLQCAPQGVNLADVKHDIEKIPGIESVHELHVWQLDEKTSIASAHVLVSDPFVSNFMEQAKTVGECLHAYGIHSATLQPELLLPTSQDNSVISSTGILIKKPAESICQIPCGQGICEYLMCGNGSMRA